MKFDEILEKMPYSLNKEKKEKLLMDRLLFLTEYHKEYCSEYARILASISYSKEKVKSYKDIPFLPVRLFKELPLKSVSDDKVVKMMTSSGTSGQSVSKIYLDKVTSSNQQKTMVKIVSEFTGSSRMPMIIIDCPSAVKDRRVFSARGAGILGFSIFGTKKMYALNDEMQLDISGLQDFLEKYKGEKILLFGFTFIIWQYFYKELLQLKEKGIAFDLSNAILIHGGGWKKLINEAVSSKEFHQCINKICGLNRIHNYYGMVEQTGCIYMECECGHLHSSIYSDVIVRNPEDFSECEIGEKGILQVVSTIPESYPGHSLLTEDEGMILGEDDCPCGRKGKYFKIYGRLKNAEIRGCSDTFTVESGGTVHPCENLELDVFDKIDYLVGDKKQLMDITNVIPKRPFAQEVLNFFADLSKELMTNEKARVLPDVVTLGFWIRESSLLSIKDRFLDGVDNYHVGRGVVFHISPSNVPVNYAYSLFSGLLCGNASVVRIPSKEFPQIKIINEAISKTLEKHTDIAPYIILIRYDKNKEINDALSKLCDTRIIWGGDATIVDLRKSELPTRATEITFADRYSLAIIDSDTYMNMTEGSIYSRQTTRIASDFYNDTYVSDQNACTSPKIVVWTGSEKENAKNIFWDRLYALVKEKYLFQPIQGIDKLSMQYKAAISYPEEIKQKEKIDNRLIRIAISKPTAKLMKFQGNSGFFYEYDCNDIIELRDICNDTHCQTISLCGNIDILRPLLDSGVKGIDRIVSTGHTMDFDFIWDGYNLFERLTRIITGFE